MSSVLQTDQWAAFKAKYGWQSRRIHNVLILSRPIIAGRKLWYAPETHEIGQGEVWQFTASVLEQAKKDNAFVFRLELAVPHSGDFAEVLKEYGFHKSFESVQPEWRAVVDIRPDNEHILSSMHQKGRYNIRVAERHGVVVAQSDDLDRFFKLYVQTAKRDGFAPRSKAYLTDFLTMVPGARLFLAHKDDKDLAGAIIVFFQDSASYLYGASSSEDRQLMAPHLLHWEVMQAAKRHGCRSYDLGEIPPQDVPDHPLRGLGDFKMKFGAKAVHLMGSWDYVLQPFWYRVFRAGETWRRGFRAR
jgi:lipid II:glycine glycyltransferase (peptidoglycan interpeptide bridge formation enzyme)